MEALLAFGIMVCVAHAPGDRCVFHSPEEGVGHVAYSRSIETRELMREAIAECEVVHGVACEHYCYLSRGEHD